MHTPSDSSTTSEKSERQQGSEKRGRELYKRGDFIMLTREIIRKLRTRYFSGDEKSICLVILEQTIGHHCERRNMSIETFMEATEIPKRTLFKVVKNLIQRGVITYEKKKGQRGGVYGLSVAFFERLYPGQIENVYYLDKFESAQAATLSKCPPVHFQGANAGTLQSSEKVSRPAPVARIGKRSKVLHIFPNISKNISQRELLEFLGSRSVNTKSRWSTVVSDILGKHPEDGQALWLAIDLVHKTNKDFLGNAIRSSALRLFEVTDWETMKTAMLYKIKREKEDQGKKKEKEENQRLIDETRTRLQEEVVHGVDISTLAPRWQNVVKRRIEI